MAVEWISTGVYGNAVSTPNRLFEIVWEGVEKRRLTCNGQKIQSVYDMYLNDDQSFHKSLIDLNEKVGAVKGMNMEKSPKEIVLN